MSLTVLEQITAAIAARLGTISGSSVVRPLQIGKLPDIENKTLMLVQGDAFKNEALSEEGNPLLQAWDQEFAIDLFIRESETDTTPIDKRTNDLYGKVVAALTTGTKWETWGSLAIMTTFDSLVPFSNVNGTFSGLEMTLTVTYRHRENDPYNAG